MFKTTNNRRSKRRREEQTVKQSRAFVEQRRQIIAKTLQEEGRVSISELAKRLEVSPLTIRRDIAYLEESGLVYRRYGEAVLVTDEEKIASELKAGEKQFTGASKEAIAKAAAELVEDDDSIFVNTSSTALMTISKIERENVTIITNSTKAGEITPAANITILVTGGQVWMPRGVLSGEFALANIRSVSANRCYVGCAGISATAGITSTTLQEATVNSLMLERSDYHVLLTDSSKLGTEAGFAYSTVSNIDMLITDVYAPSVEIKALQAAGLKKIIQVDPNDPDTWKA